MKTASAAHTLVGAAVALSALLLADPFLGSSHLPAAAGAAAAGAEEHAEAEDVFSHEDAARELQLEEEQQPPAFQDQEGPGPVVLPEDERPQQQQQQQQPPQVDGPPPPEAQEGDEEPPEAQQQQQQQQPPPPPPSQQQQQQHQPQAANSTPYPFPGEATAQLLHDAEELEGLQSEEPAEEQHQTDQNESDEQQQQQQQPEQQQQRPRQPGAPATGNARAERDQNQGGSSPMQQQQQQQQQQQPTTSVPAAVPVPALTQDSEGRPGAPSEPQQQQQQQAEGSVPDPRQGRCTSDELAALTRHFADGTACPAFGCIDKESSNYLALIEKHYQDRYSPAEASAFAGVLAACHCRCPVMRCEVEYVNQNGTQSCRDATREFCLQSNHKFSDKCAMVAKQLPKVYDIDADPHAFKSPCQVCEAEMPEAAAMPIATAARDQQSVATVPSVSILSTLACVGVTAALLVL
ncbi:hypothetical protein Esti_004200 [Eimeria stiedai]